MSKSMGFRNSGKLDLRGKGPEYAMVGVLVVVIVAALIFAGTQLWSCGGPAMGTGEIRVKCTACGEEWEIDRKDAGIFSDMMVGMGGESVSIDCDKCGEKDCVFLMTRCPKCKKYYLSKRITNPEAYEKGDNREICPHCGTDLYEWIKEHHKR